MFVLKDSISAGFAAFCRASCSSLFCCCWVFRFWTPAQMISCRSFFERLDLHLLVKAPSTEASAVLVRRCQEHIVKKRRVVFP